MRVLVTGHRGYIGSVLTRVLQHARFDVVGLDSDWFRGCDFGRVRDDVPCFDCDVRDIEFADLLSFDAVVHLAALSDDACGSIHPGLTRQINTEATQRLAECCKQAGVKRFVFASSCSVYGRTARYGVDERGPVAPLSPYASSKLLAEQAVLSLADADFSPVCLRHATVYGVSPRLRLDLVVNDFVGAAVTAGRIAMRTKGIAWRPFVHVGDLARAYVTILTAPTERIHGQVFNIVAPQENHRIIDVADIVVDRVPRTSRVAAHGSRDERSYAVDGAKFARVFPDFSYRWSLPIGVTQLRSAMLNAGLTPTDWRSDLFRRQLRLKSMIERGNIGADLRQATPETAHG